MNPSEGIASMLADPNMPMQLHCLEGRDGYWLLMAGRRLIAAFASRGEAGDYARDLAKRGVEVMVRFEARRGMGFAGD